MEGRKPAESSSSELLGSKDSSSSASSSSSSSGIFGAIFAPPLNSPKVLCRESLRSELTRKKFTHDQQLQHINSQPGDYYNGIPNQGKDSSYYNDQRSHHPCHLSSSIHYGGQDIYHHPQNSHNSGNNSTSSTYNKDGTDDYGSASRGNWWQGSLYY